MHPPFNRDEGVYVEPLSEVIVGEPRSILLTLLLCAVLLLAIACVNVARLLLVRSENHRKWIAMRSALSAKIMALPKR